MKFDPFMWLEVQANVENQGPKGRLQVMCSEKAAIYITCQGYEVLAQVGHETHLRLNEDYTYRVVAPKGARVFVKQPPEAHHKTAGTVFTNIDRLPQESGSVLEVTKALRQFKLEQRALRNEMAIERREINRAREALKALDKTGQKADLETAGKKPEEPEVKDNDKPEQTDS